MKHMVFEGMTAGLLMVALAGCSKSQQLASGEAYVVDKPDCAAAWSSTTAYGGGANISRNGRNYTAAYQTQGQDPVTNGAPDGSGKPWISGSLCNGSPPV